MAKRKETHESKLPVFDIHTAAYLEYKNISPELSMQGTRIVFEFPATDVVYESLREYQNNPAIPILDYVNHLRRLRGKMLAAKENGNEYEKGGRYGQTF